VKTSVIHTVVNHHDFLFRNSVSLHDLSLDLLADGDDPAASSRAHLPLFHAYDRTMVRADPIPKCLPEMSVSHHLLKKNPMRPPATADNVLP
jgi:hypothetical protein